METILRNLNEVEGVQGAFVFDPQGALLGYYAHVVFDADLLAETSKTMARVISSYELQDPGWDEITARFVDGCIVVRRLESAHLGVIADQRLDGNFAKVAIRVAIQKIKKHLSGAGSNSIGPGAHSGSQAAAGSHSSAMGPQGTSSVGLGSGLNSPGLTWSGSIGSGSTASNTQVLVATQEASAALTRCTKALAKAVGPIARVLVRKAAQRLTEGEPFTESMLPQLVAELSKQIAEQDERQEFRQSVGH